MEGEDAASLPPATERASYRVWTYEKLRYGDMDRQGHVNNAVFATYFETGRVGFLYDQELALREPGCEFVIAHLAIDFRAELHYPGTIDIGTRVLKIGRSSFTVGQGVFKEERCCATATSALVQMNSATRRPHPLSAAMTSWLGQHLAV
ncbi:MAG: acyl-CoA thioesterase [Alphaproteobacteria bacterium]|nr:acyl-CoA thioesterase [Alphaproteobacteria bacterium]